MFKKNFPAGVASELQEILQVLKRRGAQRVILYGSFARGDFREDSDFDLCVEGIPSRNFFLAIAECLMSTSRPVSVVDFKDIKGYFRERILAEGKVIYDNRGVSEGSPIRA